MRIIGRSEWGARKPKKTLGNIKLPSKTLWVHHTAGNEGIGPHALRRIQNFHMDGRGWTDIAYSFVIDPTGQIFEGRGAGRVGAHTRGHNATSHGICLIGNFQQTEPTSEALDALAELVALGAKKGWWPSSITGGHRDAPRSTKTACPGKRLHKKLKDVNVQVESLMATEKKTASKKSGGPEYVEFMRAEGSRTVWVVSKIDGTKSRLSNEYQAKFLAGDDNWAKYVNEVSSTFLGKFPTKRFR